MMDVSDKMAYLHRMREKGKLTEVEFERAKAGLLAWAGGASVVPGSKEFELAPTGPLQAELNRLDREWMIEQDTHKVSVGDGKRVIPTFSAVRIAIAIIATAAVIFWMISIGAPFYLPLVSIIFLAVVVSSDLATRKKAQAYDEAERAYQRRRAEVLARHDQANAAQGQSAYQPYR